MRPIVTHGSRGAQENWRTSLSALYGLLVRRYSSHKMGQAMDCPCDMSYMYYKLRDHIRPPGPRLLESNFEPSRHYLSADTPCLRNGFAVPDHAIASDRVACQVLLCLPVWLYR